MEGKKIPGRERLKVLDSLLDAGSFVEILVHVSDAEVTTGYGTVYGRLVFVYLQHGVVNVKHARKIQNLYDSALKMGAPVVGLLNSKGMKLDVKKDKNETIDIFDAYGTIFSVQLEAKGIIPQISVVLGDCLGMAGIIPSVSDFVFASSKSRIFFSSPSTYEGSARSLITPSDEYGSAEFCSKNGLVHISEDDRPIESIKDLIGFLPSNTLESANAVCTDDLNRTDEALNNLTANRDYDIKQIICSIADNGVFFEVKPKYLSDTVTGFVRFNGFTAGIIALRGELSADSMDKASEFVGFCNGFNIPLVTLTDATGFEGTAAGDIHLMKSAANMYRAFRGASVPKVNVIVDRAYGASYFMANSRHCGADIVLAWNGSKVSVVNPEAASAVLKMKIDASPGNAAALGYIDDIIEPAETRKLVIASLEMLSSKKVDRRGGRVWKI